MTPLTIDIARETDEQCGKDCFAFVDKWSKWGDKHGGEMAFIDVSSPNRYFDKTLDAKSRNMIRKAEKNGYTYKTFNYNSYLNDIYKINTSREIRQGKPMSEAYTQPPRPMSRKEELCDKHQHIWVGGFKEQQLLAYCSLVVLNEVAIINTILGHDKALTYGIMNGLMNKLVWVSFRSGAHYLNYLDLDNCTESMNRFKRSVGFEAHEVSFV